MRAIGFLLVLAVVSQASLAIAEPRRDPVTLRLGTLAVDGSRYMKDILALGKEIDRRTRGSVQLAWLSGGQLGEETAMVALMTAGKLDGGGFSETGLGAIAADMAAWGAPGLFHTYEDVDAATAALDSTVRELFAKREMEFVMWADLGFARVFSSAPITSLGDALADPALAMPLDGKLTKAITSGTIRAWSLPPLYTLAIGGKPKVMANLRHRYVVGGLVLSRVAWARLTADEQTIVREVCRDYERIRASWRKETERGIAALAKAGVKTHATSETEVAAFVASSAKAPPAKTAAKLHEKIIAAIKR